MKTILKTTMAIAVAAILFTGCDGIEEKPSNIDTGSTGSTSSSNGSSSSTGANSISIQKQGSDFTINWNNTYSGYAEVIYTDGSTGLRGNGYPLTTNGTGNYTLTCEMTQETSTSVSYRCARPDITLTSGVTLKKGVEYMWLVSEGFDHEHGEVQAVMEYTGSILTIQ